LVDISQKEGSALNRAATAHLEAGHASTRSD
jgi:hypothetical protein